jgi:hypothetical protein
MYGAWKKGEIILAETCLELVENISTFYSKFQDVKRKSERLKAVIQAKYFAQKEDSLYISGYLIRQTPHRNWTWKPEVYDYLEEEAKLPLAVTIPPELEERYDIKQFRLERETYLKINPKRLKKTQMEQRKLLEEQEEENWMRMSLPELVAHYQSVNLSCDIFEQKYDNRRKRLFDAMKVAELNSVSGDCGSFSVLEKGIYYDVPAFFKNPITKKMCFAYRKQKRKIWFKDLYTNEEFIFYRKTTHDGHDIHFKKNTFFVDQIPLTASEEDSAAEFQVVFGEVPIDAMTFFRNCPISGTKIDDLLQRGLLIEKQIYSYRYVKDENDIALYFECIHEESLAQRKLTFQNKNLRKSQAFLEHSM